MALLEQALLALPVHYLGLSGLAFAISLHAVCPCHLTCLGPSIDRICPTCNIDLAPREDSPAVLPSDPRDTTRIKYQRRFRLLNARLINALSTNTVSPEKSKQSRLVFLILQNSKLLIYYVMQTTISPALFDEILIDILPSEVAPYQQSLWRPLDGFMARECLNVIFVTLSAFWTTLVYLDGTNSPLAMVSVTIGLDEPEDWPPLFGDLSQAIGLRRFWSRFWHNLPTKPYRSVGEFVSLRVFNWEPGPFAHKLTIALVAFGLSDATHAIVDRLNHVK